MAYIQNGVLPKSEMFFFPIPQNRSLFYYPISAGHFYCDSNYRIERDNFDSILVMFIVRGSFSFIVNGIERTAHSGDVALIDCFNAHTYYTNDSFEAYWIHINGANTYELFKEINARYSGVIPADVQIEEKIKDIYGAIKNSRQISENEMSLDIYELFMRLFAVKHHRDESTISRAIDFISLHYDENITVENIAETVHLSVSQFSRKFKKQTGTSPYDYILSVRLTKAKELLKNTSLPVSEIAYRTGFQSDSNFIYFFKKQEGISPLKFRKVLY